MEPELKLKVPDTVYVCRPRPYGIDSAMWESQARAAAKQTTAIMDSDVLELIEDEEYPPTLTLEPAVWDSLDERSRHLWGLKAILVKSLEDPDIDTTNKGKHKSGRMVPLVLEGQPQYMNLIGRMARNIRFADDEVRVTIQFYADAVCQLRMTEVSAAPKREDELQRIIKAQRDRVHPYLHLSDRLRLANWSDSQWRLDDAHLAMDQYYMARTTSLEQTLYQLNPRRQELDGIKQHAQWL